MSDVDCISHLYEKDLGFYQMMSAEIPQDQTDFKVSNEAVWRPTKQSTVGDNVGKDSGTG